MSDKEAKTWLHTILDQYGINQVLNSDFDKIYNQVFSTLTDKSNDTITKVELLEDVMFPLLGEKTEEFVRFVLKILEEKSENSLLEPLEYSQTLSSAGGKKAVPLELKPFHLPSSAASSLIDPAKTFISSPAGEGVPVIMARVDDARVDDVLESALVDHFSEMKLQGLSTESLDAVDPYEQELDVYTTLSPAMLVQNLFSHMTPEQIDQVLEQHHYNIEDTMDSLFNFQQGPSDDHDTQDQVVKKPSKQVCRHFLLGQCYRSDCWFSHDPEVVLCKFWLKGRCYKGDSCEFSHGQALEQISQVLKAPVPAASPAKAPPSIDDFPALGNTASPAGKKIDFWAPSNYNDALKKAPAPADRKAEAAAAIHAQKKKYLKSLDSIDWVETGTSLNNNYLELRKDAIEVALNRNKLFQQATEAYLAGNKAAARQLSLTAHQLNSQVSSLHSEAARTIFNQRNQHLYQNSNDKDVIIDLHGLHPTESIDILDESIKSLLGRKYRGKVVIVTGTGHHSRGRAKVLPVVRSHLEKCGWKPRDASLSDGRDVCGVFPMIAEEDFDDLPPLEDLSHVILSAAAKQQNNRPVPVAAAAPVPTKAAPPVAPKQFSGIKKGFFDSKPKAKPKSTVTVKQTQNSAKNNDEIPYIKYQEKTKNSLEFSEVRDAMASQFEQSRSEWMTPDFLNRIEKSPVLSKAFQDPRFLQLSQELAKDPINTMKKVANTMPQYIEALKEFSALIGDAMEKIADKREGEPELDDREQALVNAVMKTPRVQEALKDPFIQDLLVKLRQNANLSIAQVLHSSPPHQRSKIQALIDCGLLSVI